jgi:hypothetical protein
MQDIDMRPTTRTRQQMDMAVLKNKKIPGLVGGAPAGKPGASCPQQSQLAHAPTLQDAVKQVVRERVEPRVSADGNRGREAQGGIYGR